MVQIHPAPQIEQNMIEPIERPDITSAEQLDRELVKFSKQHPDQYATAGVTFGLCRLYLYDQQPRTDTPDTVASYQEYGGFHKSGEVREPTKRWFRAYQRVPYLG